MTAVRESRKYFMVAFLSVMNGMQRRALEQAGIAGALRIKELSGVRLDLILGN
jgi:hypothetical protein